MFHRHLSNPTRQVITGQSSYFNTQRFAESVFLGIHERHLQCPSSDFCNLKVEMQYAVLTIFHVSHHAGKSTITNRNDMPSERKTVLWIAGGMPLAIMAALIVASVPISRNSWNWMQEGLSREYESDVELSRFSGAIPFPRS